MPTATTPASTRPASIWIGLLVLYLVWGSTYLAVWIAVDTIPPFLMVGFRFFLAGLVLLAWTVARDRRSFKPPTRREWRDSAIVGALLIAGGMGTVGFGEQTVPSGITALLIATMPVWVVILSQIFLGERPPRLALAGIVIGFVGVAILIGPSAVGGSGALDPVGLTAILLSPIMWVAGSLFASHRAVLPRRPLEATGLQMVCGGLLLIVIAVPTGELSGLQIEAFSMDSIIAFFYLTVMGSLVAFTVYGWLLRVAPLPLIATYAYVNPVVAVILGALILGEPIGLRTAVAGSAIVFAVALIVTSRSRMQAPRQAVAADQVVAATGSGSVRAPIL